MVKKRVSFRYTTQHGLAEVNGEIRGIPERGIQNFEKNFIEDVQKLKGKLRMVVTNEGTSVGAFNISPTEWNRIFRNGKGKKE